MLIEDSEDHLATRFKKTLTSFDYLISKESREQYSVELRRSKRYDNISKRRNEHEYPRAYEINYTIKDLPELILLVKSSSIEDQKIAVFGLRKILTDNSNLAISHFMNIEILDFLKLCLQRFEIPVLQIEAT